MKSMPPAKKILITSVAVCAVSLVCFAACGTQPPYTPPAATIILSAAPLRVEMDALYDEWLANPENTLAKYKNGEIYFKTVPVEELSLAAGAGGPFVRSGNIKFYAAAASDLEKISVGDPVDVVGKLSGVEDGVMIISGSWIRVVDTRKPAGY